MKAKPKHKPESVKSLYKPPVVTPKKSLDEIYDMIDSDHKRISF